MFDILVSYDFAIVLALSGVNLRILLPNCFLVMDIFPPPPESHSRWLGSAYFGKILFAFAIFLVPLAADIVHTYSVDDRVIYCVWTLWCRATLDELFCDIVDSSVKYFATAP